MSNNRNRNYQNTKGRSNHSTVPQQKPQVFQLGATAFINVTDLTTGNNYHCVSRVVRLPKFKGDTKYKVVVTGVRIDPTITEEQAARLIGMRIVRFADVMLTKEWSWNSPGTYWFQLDPDKADALAKRTIKNIKKDILLKQRNPIKFLG